MDKGLIIIPSDDPIARLRSTFPEIWEDLLERADPDTPFLMYSGLAELLLQRRSDGVLWTRAYGFFEEMATNGDTYSKEILMGALETLQDSDISDTVDKRLGQTAQALFRSCKL